MKGLVKLICSVLAGMTILTGQLFLSGCTSETTIDDLVGVWEYEGETGGKTVVEILPNSNGTMKIMSGDRILLKFKAGYQVDNDNNILKMHLLDNRLNQTTATLKIEDGWLYTMEGDKMEKR